MVQRHYAAFGHPMAHALSPRLHAHFGQLCGVDLTYDAIDVEQLGDFEKTVDTFFKNGGSGANVTSPYKAAALKCADECTPLSRLLGSTNILTRLPDGRIHADSNDGDGLVSDLETRRGLSLRGRRVVLIGAGGAARAVAVAMLSAGISSLVVANRTFDHAMALADALGKPSRLRVVPWGSLQDRPAPDLLVNATSAGVNQDKLSLPSSVVGEKTTAYDLSYGAAAKPFVDWALGSGAAGAYDGLGMLVETAAASFARWNGVEPDRSVALAWLLDEQRREVS